MSIQLGKAIYTILSGNSIVYNYVGTKIYPMVIPEEILLPAIVYERNSTPIYSRDGVAYSDSNFEITILSEVYIETIDISTAVFNALNNYTGTIADVEIGDIRLLNVDETFA